MVLVERFWEEYKNRFGEPELPMPDLGRDSVTIRMERDGIVEELEINGKGYIWNWHMPESGYSRIELILGEIRKYNINGKIVREDW